MGKIRIGKTLFGRLKSSKKKGPFGRLKTRKILSGPNKGKRALF